MGLLTGLRSGRESMLSHGLALSATGDNIANTNTTGFKASRAEFGELLAQGEGAMMGAPETVGNGSRIDRVATLHGQGTIQFTGRSTDFAIDGNGFFVLNDGTDDFYSRAGNFSTDPDGNLVSLSGLNLMGFTEASPDTAVALNINAASTATASTAAIIGGNLDPTSGSSDVPAAGTTDFSVIKAASQFQSSYAAFDGLGDRHDISLYFFQDPATAGSWTVQAYIDSGEIAGGTAGEATLVGTGTIAFGTDGLQTAESSFDVVLPAFANGAGTQTITTDTSEFTGYASPSAMDRVTANGNSVGNFVGIELQSDGTISALLDNGTTVVLGTVALAKFVNPEGLTRNGDNLFRQSNTSGDPDIGAPSTGGRGALQGGALEGSNVDLASEFVTMITLQRGYQAGSSVVSTMNEIINNTIQIA